MDPVNGSIALVFVASSGIYTNIHESMVRILGFFVWDKKENEIEREPRSKYRTIGICIYIILKFIIRTKPPVGNHVSVSQTYDDVKYFVGCTGSRIGQCRCVIYILLIEFI